MAAKFAVLPCNGLDKPAGCAAREIGLRLAERGQAALICPVLAHTAAARYEREAAALPTIVIDGCATRCASRLAAERGFKVAQKVLVSDEAKKAGRDLGDSLRLSDELSPFIDGLVTALLEVAQAAPATAATPADEGGAPGEQGGLEYDTHIKDKFIFRVPRSGFLFNENDCWLQPLGGNRARVGVTDFVQQSLSDIIYVTLPALGTEVEQFSEIGAVESAKAVFELVSPASGRVVAVNDALLTNPEFVNENPYEKGWLAEIELTDLAADRDLLLDAAQYMEILKRKVAEFHV